MHYGSSSCSFSAVLVRLLGMEDQGRRGRDSLREQVAVVVFS